MNIESVPICVIQYLCDEYLNFVDVNNLRQMSKMLNKIKKLLME